MKAGWKSFCPKDFGWPLHAKVIRFFFFGLQFEYAGASFQSVHEWFSTLPSETHTISKTSMTT